jgi:hypothetical protein
MVYKDHRLYNAKRRAHGSILPSKHSQTTTTISPAIDMTRGGVFEKWTRRNHIIDIQDGYDKFNDNVKY